MTVSAADRVMKAVNDTLDRMPVGGDLGTGLRQAGRKDAPTSDQRRVRNALA